MATVSLDRPKPKPVYDWMFSRLDGIPWWVLVLVALAVLVALFIFSPADVVAGREVAARDIRAGGTITYKIVVSNGGPAEAVRIGLTETLPAGVEFVSAKPVPKEVRENVLLFDVSDLARGREAVIEVTIRSTAAAKARELLPALGPQPAWRTLSIDILEFLSMGVRVTVTVTLYAFVLASMLGLIAGLGRVTKAPGGVSTVVTPRFAAVGAARVAAGLAAYWAVSSLVPMLPALSTGLAVGLGAVLYLAPVVLHPYTISTLYVEVFRGVPMLVQVLYLGFVVRPYLKSFLSQIAGTPVEFSEFNAAVLGLGLGYGAYLAEVFRAGIQSIHRGQMEAARSLGMSYAQGMRYVVLPQAIRRVLPPLANDGVALLKDSSFVSVLAVADLTRQGRLYMSRTYRAFESWNMVAISYLVLTFMLSGVARLIEKKLAQDEQ